MMVHLNNLPGQRDITASALIIRETPRGPLALVHLHRKLGLLLQVGGHVELDETPWAAVVHEIREEAGYGLDQLAVLQPYDTRLPAPNNVAHPLPAVFDTHRVNDTPHYHSDLLYALVTSELPAHQPTAGESRDLRWYTLAQLHEDPLVLPDNAIYYGLAMEQLLTSWLRIPAKNYSLGMPGLATVGEPAAPRS